MKLDAKKTTQIGFSHINMTLYSPTSVGEIRNHEKQSIGRSEHIFWGHIYVAIHDFCCKYYFRGGAYVNLHFYSILVLSTHNASTFDGYKRLLT